MVPFKSEVVAQRGMNHRGFRIKRGAHVRHRLQLLIFNPDDFRRVLCDGAASRHNGGDGFALPAGTIDRNRVLRSGFESLQMR